MSISSEITSMGENLKKDYQSIANLGADLTNVDKNIENIAELLDGVYDVLPKTSFQEGTEITLSNTLKGKLDYDNGVVGIGQTKQESTQGYNIVNTLNFSTTTINGVTCTNNGDGTFTINGTATADTNFNLINGNNVINWSAGTYKLLGQPSGDSGWDKFILYFNNWDGINCYSGQTKTLSSATTSLSLIIRIGNGKTYNNLTFFPMITTNISLTNDDCEKYTGGQASPNPSYPQTINSVTGNQDVVVSGKNLLDMSNAVGGTNNGITCTFNSDKSYSFSGTATNNNINVWFLGNYNSSTTLFTLKAGTYHIQDVILFNGTTPLNYSNFYNGPITLANDTNITGVRAPQVTSGTTYNETKYPMIVEGSTSAPYEPYITPTSYQLSLGDIELCGIGNYKDELIYDVVNDKVYKNEKIGKLVLNGSEDYAESSSQPTSNLKFYLSQNVPDAKYFDGNSYVVGSALNNYLKDFDQNEYTSGTKEGFLIAQNGMNFCISNMTLQEFKTKLQQNNMEICYITNATKEIPITDTTLKDQIKALYNAHSLNGTTIITSNGNLPMIIKVRGLKGE